MRYILIIAILGLLRSTAFAQAADPNALFLNDSLDIIEGWGNHYDVLGNLNVGYQNDDEWQDFEITSYYSGNSNYGAMRFGGNLIFDSLAQGLQVVGRPTVYADLDADGVGDLIVDNFWFHKGRTTFPYLDSESNITLRYHDFDPYLIGALDYDGDSQKDLLLLGDDVVHSFILLYKGGKNFGSKAKNYPDDSLAIPASNYYTAIAQFRPNHKPMIVLAWKKKIYLLPNDTILHDDSLVLLSDTTNGISVTNVYATDITGDGIPDLLIADGLNIYIFNGGSDFGTYPLDPAHAFYRIKSPRLLDFGNYGSIKNFGSNIHACGDITGSGIPFIAVTGEIDVATLYKGYSFFYAGGKALDSLFDASISVEGRDLIFEDTLHRINSTGRTAGLLTNYGLTGLNFDNLVFRGCEKIPHVTNPQMVSAVSSNEVDRTLRLKASAGGGFVTIEITGTSEEPHSLSIYNILGQEVISRKIGMIVGSDKEQFTTIGLPDGTYFAMLRGARSYGFVKFPISRTLYDNSPENPVFMGVH